MASSFSGKRDPSVTWSRRPSSELDLKGKTVAVVGGTNGLGRALSRVMAKRGARVIVVGRTFRDDGVDRIEFVEADLSRMSEATRIGNMLPAELDVVLLTTGIFASPKREVTSEGLERDMAVSYLSRLALVRALAPRLPRNRTPRPRVFVMGFPGTGQAGKNLDDLNAERSYSSMDVHMNTVAGNEALVLQSVRRYPHASFFGLNPGLIKTGIRANVLGGDNTIRFKIVESLIGLFTISAEKYAERIAPLLFAPELEDESGWMFNQKGDAILPTKELTEESRVEELIAASEKLLTRATSGAAASA